MNIQPAAPRIQNFHGCLLLPCDVRMHKSQKSPSRAPLRTEGDSPLFSAASRVKLIRGLFGSTKANDHIRRRLRQPNSFIGRCARNRHVDLISSVYIRVGERLKERALR